MKTTVRLAESAVMLAAAFVLSFIPVVNMPFGGSVTLCSMLPVILIAYRHGIRWGLLTGFAGSLLQLLIGLDNLSYAVSWQAVVAIILLDYVLAFTALGLGGMFRSLRVSQTTSLMLGALVCCAIRFVCHFLSGVTVWRDISIPADQAILYSISYNAAYMVPETILTLAAGAALSMVLDLRSPQPKAAERKGSPLVLLALLITIIATAVGAITLFSALQTEDGFSLTAMSLTQAIVIGISAFVAVASAVAAAILRKRRA